MAKIDISKIDEAKAKAKAKKLASKKIKKHGGTDADDPASPKFKGKIG